jgi:hypothetical protein
VYIQTYTHVSLRPRKGDIGVAEGEGSPLMHGDIKKIYSPWLKIAQFCKLSLSALSSQELDTAESCSGFAGDFRQISVLDRFHSQLSMPAMNQKVHFAWRAIL